MARPWLSLRLAVTPPRFADAVGERPGEGADAISAELVAGARDRARHRLAGTPWRVNAEVPGAELRRTWPPDPAGIAVIDHAVDLGVLSTKGAGQVTSVAWTLADLAGKPRPGAGECALALGSAPWR